MTRVVGEDDGVTTTVVEINVVVGTWTGTDVMGVESAVLTVGETVVSVGASRVLASTVLVLTMVLAGAGADTVRAAQMAAAACWAWMSSGPVHFVVRQLTIRGAREDWKLGWHWQATSVRAQPAWGT